MLKLNIELYNNIFYNIFNIFWYMGTKFETHQAKCSRLNNVSLKNVTKKQCNTFRMVFDPHYQWQMESSYSLYNTSPFLYMITLFFVRWLEYPDSWVWNGVKQPHDGKLVWAFPGECDQIYPDRHTGGRGEGGKA